MSESVNQLAAEQALAAVERGRREVIGQVDMPRWYWWSLALGWIGVGVVTDLGRPWLSLGATFLFGAGHAGMYGIVKAGRHRSSRLSVRAATVGRHASLVVLGSLLGLAGVTIGASLLAAADGARHPVTLASVLVAVMILLGGPAVMAGIRRAASRKS